VIPNILSVPGAELVGPLPQEIQSWITFTAAVSAASANQSAAREVIRLLQSPDGVRSIRKNGMEPG
jgi:molybdate transport system substrate-binding protein